MTKTMLDNIKDFLHIDSTVGNIVLVVVGIIIILVILFLFYVIAKASFNVEKMCGRPSHTLIKTIIISLVPLVYGVTDKLGELFSFNNVLPQDLKIPLIIAFCVIIAIWNFIVYGPIGGGMFTIVHTVFGLFSAVIITELVEIAVIVVILYFLLGGVGGGSASSSSSSVPSLIRDVNNGQTYHVVKGTNGELYIEGHGRSGILRSSDYGGEYFDDYGNRYVR